MTSFEAWVQCPKTRFFRTACFFRKLPNTIMIIQISSCSVLQEQQANLLLKQIWEQTPEIQGRKFVDLFTYQKLQNTNKMLCMSWNFDSVSGCSLQAAQYRAEAWQNTQRNIRVCVCNQPKWAKFVCEIQETSKKKWNVIYLMDSEGQWKEQNVEGEIIRTFIRVEGLKTKSPEWRSTAGNSWYHFWFEIMLGGESHLIIVGRGETDMAEPIENACFTGIHRCTSKTDKNLVVQILSEEMQNNLGHTDGPAFISGTK